MPNRNRIKQKKTKKKVKQKKKSKDVKQSKISENKQAKTKNKTRLTGLVEGNGSTKKESIISY